MAEELVEVSDKNVLGETLQECCSDPATGFFRNGFCQTGPQDRGLHVVCAEMTEEFLAFTKKQGNDLSTPNPQFSLPGLSPGDRWCLCASRWQEAFEAGVAPPVILSSTHEKALEIVERSALEANALDLN